MKAPVVKLRLTDKAFGIFTALSRAGRIKKIDTWDIFINTESCEKICKYFGKHDTSANMAMKIKKEWEDKLQGSQKKSYSIRNGTWALIIKTCQSADISASIAASYLIETFASDILSFADERNRIISEIESLKKSIQPQMYRISTLWFSFRELHIDKGYEENDIPCAQSMMTFLDGYSESNFKE